MKSILSKHHSLDFFLPQFKFKFVLRKKKAYQMFLTKIALPSRILIDTMNITEAIHYT